MEDVDRAIFHLKVTFAFIMIMFYFVCTLARVLVISMIEDIYNFDMPYWITLAAGGVTTLFCFGLYFIVKRQIGSLMYASYITGQSNPE
jgi:hypothetical protein